MCVCVCVYIYQCVWMCVCFNTWVYGCVYIFVCLYTHMHKYVGDDISMLIYTCGYVSIYVCAVTSFI